MSFHVPKTYFLTHSVGCLPNTASTRLGENYFTQWRDKGGNAWPDWLEQINGFRGGIANVLGVDISTICPQTNVSSALTKILHSLPERTERKTILLSEQDFPTIGFVLKQAERAGYTLKFVAGDITDPEVWADAMEDSVGIVHITHALSNTAHILPVADICAVAKAKDIITIVDIAQSVGIVPIHIPDWQVDFVIGTSVKFMCGGPGACFMYAAPEIIAQCQPLDVGWFSHENPFEMDIHNFRYAGDALRFWGGTPSPAPYIIASAAHKTLDKDGIINAHKHVQSILDGLTASLPANILVSPQNRENRGGTLVIASKDRETLSSDLTKQGILFDERTEGFRFSFHQYTPQEDVKILANTILKHT